MKQKDLITKNGYNKYHLWTSIFYDYMSNPHLENKYTSKEKRQMAIDEYLKLLKG